MKRIGEIPEDTILVTDDFAGLYPCLLHEEGLNALKENLVQEKIPSNELIKLAEFVLKTNFVEFHDKINNRFWELQYTIGSLHHTPICIDLHG